MECKCTLNYSISKKDENHGKLHQKLRKLKRNLVLMFLIHPLEKLHGIDDG